MPYRAVSCNAERPDGAADNRATIATAAKHADILLVQEGADPQVKAAITALGAGWQVVDAPQNPIAVRKSVLRVLDSGHRRIMVNRPNAADGPDRDADWVLVEEIATGKRALHVNVHLIHQAFTSHKERRPSWDVSLVALGRLLVELQGRFPGVPQVVSGDWNRPDAFTLPSVFAFEVPSPPTHGSRRYDRFFLVGGVRSSRSTTIRTRSDHLALAVTITLGVAAPAARPTPKPVVKPRPRRGPRYRRWLRLRRRVRRGERLRGEPLRAWRRLNRMFGRK